jgi:hypothetical protein
MAGNSESVSKKQNESWSGRYIHMEPAENFPLANVEEEQEGSSLEEYLEDFPGNINFIQPS